MEIEVVHGADAQNTRSRETRADAVHECAAGGAEVVGHGVTRSRGARLAIGSQLVAATEVLEMRVAHDEVGGKHGGGDFAAVCAVAEECIDQARALCWLVVFSSCVHN